MRGASKLIASARQVRRTEGAGYLRQLSEILRLLRANPTCGPNTYYDLGLYRELATAGASVYDYVGKGSSADLSECLNPRSAVAVAWDKLSFEIVANAYDLPRPETVAIFRRGSPVPRHIATPLTDQESASRYLRASASYPLFLKPCHSQQGIGGCLLRSYDATQDQVIVHGRGPVPVDSLLAETLGRPSNQFYDQSAGWLFQTVLQQHGDISRLTGSETVCGIRMVVVLDDVFGAFLHRSVFKLTTGDNAGDNFSGGSTGNMVCPVDRETGRLGPAVTGLWPDAELVREHPVSGEPLKDFVIPGWDEIKATVIDASRALGGMRIFHWDVVCSAVGPVLLEVNDLGSTYLLQIAGEGVMDERLADIVCRHGAVARFPRIGKLARRWATQ